MIGGVVLAAGLSARLGRPKQLLDLGGRPVLQRTVDAALAAPLDLVVVVIGAAAAETRAALSPNPRLLITLNPEYESGQASSLAAGLRALPAEAEAAVILLGDQPGVAVDAIRAVVDAFRERTGPIVQACYSGRPAHPTLLGRETWPGVLATVHGDAGARDYIRENAARRRLVEVGGRPPMDIDTETDYARIAAEPTTWQH